MTEILISEAVRGEPIDRLSEHWSVVEDLATAADAAKLHEYLPSLRAWIVRNTTQVTAEAIAAAPKLEVIARAGVGLDNIDCRAAEEAGVVVTFTPHENSVSVAELAIGMMIAWLRQIPAAHEHAANGGWERRRFMGGELAGRRLGIIGLGRIGCLVAARAAVFGMKLIGHDPLVSADDPRLRELGIEWLPWEELLSTADIVTCHVPLTEQTRGLIDSAALDLMQPNALLVNTSRGEIVVEAALLEALENKRIGGAALDVREVEPPRIGKLEELPNVLLTPHIGAFTHEAQARVVAAVAEDVARVLRGQAALQAVGTASPRKS